MTALSRDKGRAYESGSRAISAFPVAAAARIYEGAAVGLNSATGYARSLVSGDRCVGFATRRVDNSAGAAGAMKVEVIEQGTIRLPVTGALITSPGAAVYATDDDTFDLTSLAASFIGHVARFEASGFAMVRFDAGGWNDDFLGGDVRRIVKLTQAAYDAISSPVATTLYVIVG